MTDNQPSVVKSNQIPEQLFLLREDYQEYLYGSQLILPDGRLTQSERSRLRVLAVITLLVGCIAAYFSFISLRLTAEGIETSGAITERGTHPRGIPGLSSFVVYSYTVNGETYTQQVSVTSTIARRLNRRGMSAEIIYLPTNPEYSRLTGENQIHTETSVTIFFFLVGISLCLLMFVRPYRVRRLSREGRVLFGEVKTSRRIHGITHIRFTFLSPEGRRLGGVGSTQRVAAAPRPGVPVAVLYSNENFYRVL